MMDSAKMTVKSIARMVLSIALVAAVPALAAEPADRESVHELLQKSGTLDSLDEVQGNIQQGVENGARGMRMASEELARLLRLAGAAYAPERLKAEAERKLTGVIDRNDAKEVLAWLSS